MGSFFEEISSAYKKGIGLPRFQEAIEEMLEENKQITEKEATKGSIQSKNVNSQEEHDLEPEI